MTDTATHSPLPAALTVRRLRSGDWATITEPDADGFSSILAKCPTEAEAIEAKYPATLAAALYRTDLLTLSREGEAVSAIHSIALARLAAERAELVEALRVTLAAFDPIDQFAELKAPRNPGERRRMEAVKAGRALLARIEKEG